MGGSRSNYVAKSRACREPFLTLRSVMLCGMAKRTGAMHVAKVSKKYVTKASLGHILLRHLGYMHRPCALRHTAQHNGTKGKERFTTRSRLGYIIPVSYTHTCRSTSITPAQSRRNFGLVGVHAVCRRTATRRRS